MKIILLLSAFAVCVSSSAGKLSPCKESLAVAQFCQKRDSTFRVHLLSPGIAISSTQRLGNYSFASTYSGKRVSIFHPLKDRWDKIGAMMLGGFFAGLFVGRLYGAVKYSNNPALSAAENSNRRQDSADYYSVLGFLIGIAGFSLAEIIFGK